MSIRQELALEESKVREDIDGLRRALRDRASGLDHETVAELFEARVARRSCEAVRLQFGLHRGTEYDNWWDPTKMNVASLRRMLEDAIAEGAYAKAMALSAALWARSIAG